MLAVETYGLTKEFGPLIAVDHLDLQIKEGEIFGLLGPNGAGKTTTIRMLACLISPSAGSALVSGHDISKDPLQVRQTVGILTENPCLYDRLTAHENMDFFSEAYGVSDVKEKQSRIHELLGFFELWERRNDRVGTFSKGMKQKLAIARSLVHKPPILFLDEPTSGLDPEVSSKIRDLMKKLSHREKQTILLCTHRLEDAEKLCSRVLIVNQGKSVVIGSPDELRDRIAGQPVLRVELKEINQEIIDAVGGLKQVEEVSVDRSKLQLLVAVDDAETATPDVIGSIVYAGGRVLSANLLRPSLEEAYLRLLREP